MHEIIKYSIQIQNKSEFNAPNSVSQFAEGYKFPPEKTQSHIKNQFPPEMTFLKFQQNFQTRLKPNFLFTPI